MNLYELLPLGRFTQIKLTSRNRGTIAATAPAVSAAECRAGSLNVIGRLRRKAHPRSRPTRHEKRRRSWRTSGLPPR
jgi:hypothetical protein